MQGSAVPVVLASEFHALLLEEVQRDGLVALCRHVHHVDAEVVAHVHVCAQFQQRLYQRDVAPESREVQPCEPVVFRLLVDPHSDLFVGDGDLSSSHQLQTHLLQVLETHHVQQCVPALVNQVHYWNLRTLLQQLCQSLFVSVLHELERSFRDFLHFVRVQSGLSDFLKRFVRMRVGFLEYVLVHLHLLPALSRIPGQISIRLL